MKPGINNAIEILLSIITNKIFYVTFFTWFLAQALKIMINLSRTGKMISGCWWEPAACLRRIQPRLQRSRHVWA